MRRLTRPARRPGGSATIVALVLALLLLLVGSVLAWRSYQAERQHVEDQAASLDRAAAAQADQFLRTRLDLLETIAATPLVRSRNLSAMRAYFVALDPARYGLTGGIGWLDLNGLAQVSTNQPLTAPPTDLHDRDYVQAVLASRQPFVGMAVVGRANALAVLPLAVPTFDD